MSSELSLYKEKIRSLEAALKQKSQTERSSERRFETAELKRRVSLEDKIIPVLTFKLRVF